MSNLIHWQYSFRVWLKINTKTPGTKTEVCPDSNDLSILHIQWEGYTSKWFQENTIFGDYLIIPMYKAYLNTDLILTKKIGGWYNHVILKKLNWKKNWKNCKRKYGIKIEKNKHTKLKKYIIYNFFLDDGKL